MTTWFMVASTKAVEFFCLWRQRSLVWRQRLIFMQQVPNSSALLADRGRTGIDFTGQAVPRVRKSALVQAGGIGIRGELSSVGRQRGVLPIAKSAGHIIR